jgi:hypothetical protein
MNKWLFLALLGGAAYCLATYTPRSHTRRSQRTQDVQKREDDLDEALRESFPASDPPSPTSPQP